MKKPSLSEIENSLTEQLVQMGASVDFYKSLVADYMFYEKQERKMQADIRKRGLTYMAVSAVGKEYEKDNPSVKQAYVAAKVAQNKISEQISSMPMGKSVMNVFTY